MLSYRHAFHAGNFADVLKHVVLVELLGYLTRKDKPLHYIDTHAGPGIYDLHGAHALKLSEFKQGIGLLQPAAWPELPEYFAVVSACNRTAARTYYPGSPNIALQLLRERDRAWFFELHSTDVKALAQNVRHDERAKVIAADGLAGLLGLVPPLSNRALIMIDPAYEIKTDYNEVVKTVTQAHRKFATGTYAIWYPVIERKRVEKFAHDFVLAGIRNIQRFELCVRPDSTRAGMTGAGMLVINPPWTLLEKMSNVLPRMLDALRQERGASYTADTLVSQ